MKMTNEISEIKEPKRYLKFKEVYPNYSKDEIFKLAELGYMTLVESKGGVIDE
jgi:hypothetical protein